MVCRDFILSDAYESCLFLFAQLIVPYQWNCGAMRFSPENIGKLLLYFQEHEPERLDCAEKMYDALRGIE